MTGRALGNRIIIEPIRGWPMPSGRDLWGSRDLILFLAWRDISVRYKQTVVGIGWAILQPVASMLVMTVIFGNVIRVPSEGVPYPIFSFAGLLPWQLFSSVLTAASNSVVGNANLVSKVYFPRLVIPLASLIPALVDFVPALFVLVAMMAHYGVVPGPHLLVLPMLLSLILALSLGAGLWLSALNVEYRDIRYVVPLVLQLLLYLTPVAYPSSLISARWRDLYNLNPMVGLIEGFRWALLATAPLPVRALSTSFVMTAVILASGVVYFQSAERRFADLV